MYRKVIGFKLGSYKQNFSSLRLNILVLENMHMHINRVSLKGSIFPRMVYIISQLLCCLGFRLKR